MIRRKISMLLCSAMIASVLPSGVALAENEWFSENFEGTTIEKNITDKSKGWSYDGVDGAEVNLWVGENGNGSNSLRISNGDSWFKNIWSGLDLNEYIKESFVQQGKDEQESAEEISKVLGNDVSLSFKAKFEIQGISNDDQPHQSYVRIKDSDYNILTEIRTMDDELCIRARSEKDDSLTDFKVKNIDVSPQNNDWHDFSIEYDKDLSRCRIKVDGQTAKTDSGEWILLGTDDVKIDELSALGAMEFGEYWSGWWQCVYIDDLTINPLNDLFATEEPTLNPTKEPEVYDKKVFYLEDFSNADTATDVISQNNGWSYDSDNASGSINIKVEENEENSNALRFSSTDWYKSMWVTLDLKENGIVKRINNGESEGAAKAAVEKYLSENVTLSFRAKLDVDGISSNPSDVHESYIKVKNGETAAITELHTKGNKLLLKGLGSEEYHEIKTINITKENKEFHDFELTYNMLANTYTLKVDGEQILINGEENIPVGAGDGEAVIDSLGYIEMGHHWSGWWQRLTVDDIKLVSADAEAPEETKVPTATPENTAEPTQNPSADPTATPTAAPTMEPGIYYKEECDSVELEKYINDGENGWSYGTASGHEKKQDISIEEYGSGNGKSLRFASQDWYKNVWMTLDLHENGVYKQRLSGKNDSQAEAFVDGYLSGNMKVTFRVKFGQDGQAQNDTHEQYIRVKGEDGHVITDLHLYNNSLELIALNMDRNANERYVVKKVNWSSTSNEWHDVALYYDMVRNAYMLEIDGEIFTGTPHGKWIPAGSASGVDVSEPKEIGKVSSIEFGHFWSAWWAAMFIDDLYISEYTPEPIVFEVTNANIQNQHGSVELSPGNKYDVNVYVTGGEIKSIEKVWSKFTDKGWEPMTESTIPSGVTKIKVNITAISKNGETALFEKEANVNPSGSVDYESIMTENFEAAGKAQEITSQQNGWFISGTSIQADVSTGFGGSANALRFASTDSNLSSNLSLDLTKRGAVYNDGDKIRLKLSYAFGIGNDDDAMSEASISYVRIKDTEGSAFSAVEIHGDKMYVMYYDENEKKCKSIEIASGKSAVVNKWRNLELYLDTEINKYCILIDGKPIGIGYQKWFTPANSIVEGTGSPIVVKGIGAVDVGQENSSWWANTRIDNIALDKYYLPIENKFNIEDINLVNAYKYSTDVACGSKFNVEAVINAENTVKEDGVVTDSVLDVTYKDLQGVSKKLEGNMIPYDAVSVKVCATFKNLVGQESSCEKEFQILPNTAPSISELTVDGDFAAGNVLSAKYVFTDAESPEADNSEISWYRCGTLNGEYELVSTGAKEYTLKAIDVVGYMKVKVIPQDSYGAEGEEKELVFSSQIITDFTLAWSRADIPTSLSKEVSKIKLPQIDEETGITFKWKSSNTAVISDDGYITKPSKLTVVTLTGTATTPDGRTETKRFVVEVPGKNSSSGGSGGGGGGGNGYISTPTSVPIKDEAESLNGNEPGQVNTIQTERFPDVAKEAWYYEYVEKLAKEGIISGDEKGYFNPDDSITRAEFIKMLVEVFNIFDKDAKCNFEDVPEDSWYYGYIAGAIKFDIVNGIGNGKFGPSDKITRQDMAVMAARAAQLTGILENDANIDFADASDISSYAVESVASMAKTGIISGDNGMFKPKDYATRAQAAKIISILDDMLKRL